MSWPSPPTSVPGGTTSSPREVVNVGPSDRPAECVPVTWGSPDGPPALHFAPSPCRSAPVARLEAGAGVSLGKPEWSYRSESIPGLDAIGEDNGTAVT